MDTNARSTIAITCCLALPAALTAQQQLKPETGRDFDCYVQSAESRMNARASFLVADSDAAMKDQLLRAKQIRTIPLDKANPRKIAAGQIYDWIGTVFIPGATLDHTVEMLKDYEHRVQYFPEIVSESKLLCRTGENHFRYRMRLREPVVMDVESDVAWERVDPHRWRCRSYSVSVHEIGTDHGYLLRLYSYWRFAEADNGVYVEGENITLSREFGGFIRALGSMVGISPEKSLRHTLASMRESALKPGMQISSAPAGLPECGDAFRPGGCPAATKEQ